MADVTPETPDAGRALFDAWLDATVEWHNRHDYCPDLTVAPKAPQAIDKVDAEVVHHG